MNESRYFVAVIGAGPAGLFGARELANQGAHVVLFNRDIKPGGLAEYGIYPEKHTMKEGLRKQFRGAMDNPNLDYYGNVVIGNNGDHFLHILLIDQMTRNINHHIAGANNGAAFSKAEIFLAERREMVVSINDLFRVIDAFKVFARQSQPLGALRSHADKNRVKAETA